MQEHIDRIEAGEYSIPQYILNKWTPKTIMDVGANVGAFTIWAAKQWPETTIYCFEPVRTNFFQLETNVRTLNALQDSDIRCFSTALRTKDVHHHQVMRQGANNCGEASFYDLGEQAEETISVNVHDARAFQGCEFLKIDTEGCEVEILQGLNLQNTKFIALEYHREEDIKEIQRILFPTFKVVEHTPYRADRGILKFVHKSLAKKHVMIATPSRANPTWQFQQCVRDILSQPEPDTYFTYSFIAGDSAVNRARNNLAKQFLESDNDYLLFIDDDISFTLEDVMTCVNAPFHITGLLYSKRCEAKEDGIQWVMSRLGGEEVNGEGWLRVARQGTGFLCIARSALEHIKGHRNTYVFHPGFSYDLPTPGYDFFAMGSFYNDAKERYEWLSEDWFFCDLARKCGLNIMVQTKRFVKHIGEAIYPLRDDLTNQINECKRHNSKSDSGE